MKLGSLQSAFSQRFRVILTTIFLCFIGVSLFYSSPVELLPKVSDQKILIIMGNKSDPSSFSSGFLEKTIRESVSQYKQLSRIESKISSELVQVLLSTNSPDKDLLERIRVSVRQAMFQHNVEANFVVTNINSNSFPVMEIIIEDKNINATIESLQLYAKSSIIPKIEELRSVSKVETIGVPDFEYNISPKINVLFSRNNVFYDVIKSISTSLLPDKMINHGGLGNLDVSYRTPNNASLEDINLSLNNLTKIQNVFDIKKTQKNNASIVLYNGKKAVMLAVYKNDNFSEIILSKEVKNSIKQLTNTINNYNIDIVSDSSDYINAAQDNVISNVKWGIIFTCLCILILVKNIRYTVIVSISIPLSLALSFLFFSWLGITRNVMSLAGIALSVGVVVDAAISVLDSIDEYCGNGLAPLEASIKASRDNFIPVLMTALTTLAVFVPIIFLHGRVGDLFRDLSLTVIISQSVSFFVAIFIIPCLVSSIYDVFNIKIVKKSEGKNSVGKAFASVTKAFLKTPLAYWTVSVFFLLLVIWSISIIPAVEFLPKRETNEYHFTLEISQYDLNFNKETSMLQLDNILQTKQINRRKIIFDNGSIFGDFNTKKPLLLREITQLEQEIQQKFSPYGMHISAKNPIDINSTNGKDLVFFLPVLPTEKREALQKSIKNIPGVFYQSWSLDSKQLVGFSTKNDVRLLGLPALPSQINLTKKLAYSDFIIGYEINDSSYFANNIILPVKYTQLDNIYFHPFLDMVILPSYKNFLNKIDEVLLSKVLINGENVEQVSLLIRGKTTSEVVEKIEKIAKDNNVLMDWGEDKVQSENATESLVMCFAIAALLIISMLFMQNKSISTTIIIMFTFIWGLIGSFPGLVFHGETLNASAIVGFILLAGTIVNNGILLMDLVSKFRTQQYTPLECCVSAVYQRTIPVLVTAFTTAVGMIPMVFDTAEGSQMYRALSIVVVYGTVISTPISLVAIPCLVLIFNDLQEFFARIKLKSKILLNSINF